MINIHDVTKENVQEILKLKVLPGQNGFIETPAECLAEAEACPQFKPVGLYEKEVLVGFAMYGCFSDGAGNSRLWLDRFLIDARFQGRRLGLRFMQAMLEKLEAEFGKRPVYLSVYNENEAAIRLYSKLGFRFTGELDDKGERVMLKKYTGGFGAAL